nr:probable LRR receptor-like serine/threonine-protein kinase At1g53430 [Ipomoea trifida]
MGKGKVTTKGPISEICTTIFPDGYNETKSLGTEDDRDLDAKLPEIIGSLTNLIRLTLPSNKLFGEIPTSYANLKNLKDLNLRDNKLEGPIPPFLGDMKLDSLDLSDNSFGGPFPTQLTFLNLTQLDLSGNLFSGSFPTHLSSLVNLMDLNLAGNSFDGQIPPQLNSLVNLMFLDLSNNNLSGPLPDQLEKLVSLMHLSLLGNNFESPLPAALSNLTNLEELHISDLVGGKESQFPNFTNMDFLGHLTLRKCSLAGSIPDIIWNLKRLYFLDLSFNSLFGQIPNYSTLEPPMHIFLRGNKLNGTIPTWILNSTDVMNFFSSLNSSDDGTARVSPVSLKYYGFCLKDGEYTVRLHFAELVRYNDYKTPYVNKSGRVFDVDIQGMNVLKDFNIEKEAEGVNKAYTKEIRNVIINNSRLEIHLYWSGKGSMMYQGPLISAISVYPSKESGLSPPKMAAISLSVLILLIVLIVYFWKMEDNSHEGMVELYPGGLYNFQKVKVAAKNFKHKLGKGGFGTFYEATLGNGTVVAVEKVSATKDIIRAFREKDSTISLMEHPNLVKLMGCIAEKNQLLLVYEDIGHNSLQNALFDSDRSRLDWPKRHHICLGIAEGLAFLHEGKQKNVHGNIKPTTIFLDKQDNAKISDFGFSRLHDQGKSREEGTVVREKQEQGHFMNVVDKSISNTVDWNQADTMLELALMCLDQYPHRRPTMSDVVMVLKDQLTLKDLKESLKKHLDPQPHGEISTTHHSKSRSTSRGGMTDTGVSVSPSTGSTT